MSYLQYQFSNSETAVSCFDEMPLWSAAFGMMMFEYLRLHNVSIAVDVGSGTGFPTFELAGRLGPDAKIYGVDPWEEAVKRSQLKKKEYAYHNVEFICCDAKKMPFDDKSVDLVVSNLGVNNFDSVDEVMEEIFRILKKGGVLAITSNIQGHWQGFFDLFAELLREWNADAAWQRLQASVGHRGTQESMKEKLQQHGFHINAVHTREWKMVFANGTAFLNHHFVKIGWMTDWKMITEGLDQQTFFAELEARLNIKAKLDLGLELIVPMIYIEAIKKIH